VSVDYQGKGSGAGIQDLVNRTVDFAASDAAMTDEDMAKVPGGVQLLPMTGGEIVLAYNLPGNPKNLKLPRDVYAGIFLGKVTKWSDARLKAANPGVNLPDQDITVVRRADSSGTTFVFTSHLSAISEEWKKGPGAGTTVAWPKSDKFVASPKNDGVSATIKQTPGAIGYLEYAFAKFAKVEVAQLQNKAGQYVSAGGEGGPAALAGVQLPADLRAWVSDPDGPKSYPIATYTWMLFYKENKDPKKAAALRSLVEYCLNDGQKLSSQMGYIPLPEHVVAAVRKASASIQ
jgi:phosphate transport system substrate-binding protein